MGALPKRFFTPEEYLDLEDGAEYKSQYVAGEIFAMAGAQPAHDRLTTNLVAGLHRRFQGRPCEVFTADMRVAVSAADMYTYPDVSALCGEPRFDARGNQPPSLLNPQVIFEVLSRTTEGFDRGDKFTRYRRLESLTDYVLVSSTQMRVERHWLQENGVWAVEECDAPSHILSIPGIGCDLPLSEIYERVKLA